MGGWGTPRQPPGREGLHRGGSTPSSPGPHAKGVASPLSQDCLQQPCPPEGTEQPGTTWVQLVEGRCSPAQPPQGPAAQEAVGHGRSRPKPWGRQGARDLKDAKQEMVPISLCQPGMAKVSGPWNHHSPQGGQQLPLHASFVQAPGGPWKPGGGGLRGRECGALPWLLWLQDGQGKGQLLSLLPSRRGTPWL